MLAQAFCPQSPASLSPHACVVCGSSDARTLSTTPLASGAMVTVCGSHAVAHARASRAAGTVRELRSMLCDRRESDDRRDRTDRYLGETDELASSLTAAFSGERRGPGRRSLDL